MYICVCAYYMAWVFSVIGYATDPVWVCATRHTSYGAAAVQPVDQHEVNVSNTFCEVFGGCPQL